jgi:hypothetical protein
MGCVTGWEAAAAVLARELAKLARRELLLPRPCEAGISATLADRRPRPVFTHKADRPIRVHHL